MRLAVRIPATSANLGPGFDSLGLALDLWNTFEMSCGEGPGGIAIDTQGEGAGVLPADETNLVAQTLLGELRRLAAQRSHGAAGAVLGRATRLVCCNQVPCASGLGSSSTAVLASLIFAHALDDPRPLTMDRAGLIETVLREAAQIEGHGDNIAPALLGGLIAVSTQDGKVLARRIPLQPLRVVVCVPDFEFLTTDARARLPAQYARRDAVFNIGRALLVADALRSGDLAHLAQAMGDRIHEPYRFPAIPGAIDARHQALDHGAVAVSLSGAGPGLLAFAGENHAAIGQAMQAAFAQAQLRARYWVLDTTDSGVQILAAPDPAQPVT